MIECSIVYTPEASYVRLTMHSRTVHLNEIV